MAWAATWLAAAVLAAYGVTQVVSFLGTDLFGTSTRPRTQAEVLQALADQPSPAPSSSAPSAGPSHSVSPAPLSRRAFPHAGGTVFATCSAGLAKITWNVASGYQADGNQPGPAKSAWVRFSSGPSGQQVTVTCPAGTPQQAVTNVGHDAGDDHGGGRGGGGSGGGGSGSGGGGSGGGG
jgi:uncharacterized membrane protein YgcG